MTGDVFDAVEPYPSLAQEGTQGRRLLQQVDVFNVSTAFTDQSTGGVAAVLEFNAAVFVLALVLYFGLKLWGSSRCCTKSCLRPVWDFFSRPIDDGVATRKQSVDIWLLYCFQFDMVFLFVTLSIVQCAVLIPINVHYGPDATVAADASVASIPPGSSALWAHAVMTTFVSAVVWLVLTRATQRFRRYRWETTVSCPESQAVLIKDGLPPSTTADGLRAWLTASTAVSNLVDVLVVEDKTRYLALLTKWRQAVRQHDRTVQVARLRRSGRLPCCLRWCPGGPCCPSPVEMCRGCCARGNTHYRITAAVMDMMQAKHELVAAMSDREAQNKCSGRAFVFFKSAHDASSFYRAAQHPARLAATGDAAGAADLAVAKWKVRVSPVPGDIRWRAMATRGRLRRMRNCCIQLGVVVVLLMLTSPMAVLGALQTASAQHFNVVVDNGVSNVLKWVGELSPTASHALLQYIPTLVVVIINGILLFLLHSAGRYGESPLSGVRRELSILVPSFVYLCFNTLVVPTLLLGSVTVIMRVLYRNHDPLDIAGRILLDDSGGSFFMAYMAQRIFVGGLAEMYRPIEWLVQKWSLARAVTRMEEEEAVMRFPYEWGTQSAIQLSVVALVLVLGTMIPLLLPFGAVYFVIKHYVDKWVLNQELSDLFQDGVHPTQLEESHAWFIDAEEEVVARRSGAFMDHAMPAVESKASRAKAAEEKRRKELADAHVRRLEQGAGKAKAKAKAAPSPTKTMGRRERATAVLQKRKQALGARLDPHTFGPLAHYGGRIAHRTYSMIPGVLLLYCAAMAGFYASQGTTAQFGFLVAVLLCNCCASTAWYWRHNAAYYVEPSQEPKATATASSASGSSAKDMLQRRTQGEDTVAPLPSRRRAPHIAVPLMATSFRGNQRFVQQSQRSRSATRRHEVFLTAYRRVDEDIRVELQHILDSAAMDLKGNVQHASARSRRLRHDDNGRGRSKPSLLSSDGLATTAASAGAGGAASNGGSTDITRDNDVHLQVVP